MITEQPLFEWAWVVDNLDLIGAAVLEHLELTGLAVAFGLLVSLPLALVALRWRRTYGAIIGLGGVLYSIPSLAAFAFLRPFTGLTTTTAVIALVTYTLLILVRNIVAGIDSVPDDVTEAARGMGFRPLRLLLRVELPLALPVIIAGVRIATVTVIGLVTVTALLGLGGLGQLILFGFRVQYPPEIVVGVVLSIALAVAFDLALLGCERVLTPWSRRAAA